MTNVEIKYLTAPHDGQPGTIWDDFAERLRSVAAGQTDKRGYSLADTMDGTDEGGPELAVRPQLPHKRLPQACPAELPSAR